MKLSDMELATDMLGGLKALSAIYLESIHHSSCPKMRKTLETQHKIVLDNQFKLFEYMNTNGMYPVKNAPDIELNQAITKFAKK